MVRIKEINYKISLKNLITVKSINIQVRVFDTVYNPGILEGVRYGHEIVTVTVTV